MEQTKKLRIAVLIKRFISSGGAERYAVEVARRLLEKGHYIDVFARIADRGLLKGINFHQVPDKLRFSSVLNSFSFALETAHMLRGTTYDVIHSHERGYLQDISTVHTFSYKKGTEKYSLLKKIDQIYLSPRSGLHLWLERKQMSAPRLVAVSAAIREDIRTYYKRDKGVSVNTPGVDTAWFHPSWVGENRKEMRREEKISADEMVVLFVGSEFRRKGLDCLIPAIGPGMRLLIVGKGERERHYRRLVSKYGMAQKVHFKGLSDNIRIYFALADVVVLPSLSDAFGMSILEAMACGHPVVCSANAGVSALIEDGINGFTFHDPSKLSAILMRLLDPIERRRAGAKARKTAEKHTWDVTADRYEKVYRQVAEQKRSSVFP